MGELARGDLAQLQRRRCVISIVLDSAFHVAAADSEALTLLAEAYGNGKTRAAATDIPPEFKAVLRAHYDASDIDAFALEMGDLSINVRALNGTPRSYLVSLEPNDARYRLQQCVARYGITRREEQVLLLIIEGMRGYEIALELGISPITVRDHCTNLLRKTETHSRWEMLAKLMRG